MKKVLVIGLVAVFTISCNNQKRTNTALTIQNVDSFETLEQETFTDIDEPIKNAKAILNFSKQKFETRVSQLNNNKWEIIDPISSKEYDVFIEKSVIYHKRVSDIDYNLTLSVGESTKTTTIVDKTVITLFNGDIFDKWEEEFKNMGFDFQKLTDGENGFLYAGKKGILIKMGIPNIDNPPKDWYYEINIIVEIAKMN